VTNKQGNVYELRLDRRSHSALEVEVAAGESAWFTMR
jgi:hypothetical protein